MTSRIFSRSSNLVGRARLALGVSQREIGELVGVSTRTSNRWHTSRTEPGPDALRKLAVAVLPIDPALAEEIANHTGTTLDALRPPPPAPLPVAAPAPPLRAFPPFALLVDSILMAAADALDPAKGAPLSREDVLGAVRAAFERARALGLTVEEVLGGMGGAAAQGSGKSRQGK